MSHYLFAYDKTTHPADTDHGNVAEVRLLLSDTAGIKPTSRDVRIELFTTRVLCRSSYRI